MKGNPVCKMFLYPEGIPLTLVLQHRSHNFLCSFPFMRVSSNAYLEPEAVPRVCYPVFSVQQFLFIQPHVEMQSIVQPAIHLPQ